MSFRKLASGLRPALSLRRQGHEPRRPLPFAGRVRLLCAKAHGARNLARRRSLGTVGAWKLHRSGSGSATGLHSNRR